MLLRRGSDLAQIGGMLKAVDVHWEAMEPCMAISAQIWRLKFSKLFQASGRPTGHVRATTCTTACYFLNVCCPELVSSNIPSTRDVPVFCLACWNEDQEQRGKKRRCALRATRDYWRALSIA